VRAVTRSLAGAYALTLKNPWAHLIAHRGKHVENRSWMPHAHVNTLLIHAGKGWDEVEGVAFDGLTTSAIVAVADLAFACSASRCALVPQCGCGIWARGEQCHWNLTNVVSLPEPVAASGRQGLWRPDLATLAAVRAQLEAVGA
jgi:hypothetical protein